MSIKFNRIHESQIKLWDFSAYFWNTPRIYAICEDNLFKFLGNVHNSLVVHCLSLLHRNSTVARRVTNVTSEHYGDPQGYNGQNGTRGATYGLSGRCLLSLGSN